MSKTVEQLWQEAWPEVRWEDASSEDKRLFLAHANSLRDWEASK